MIVVKTQRNGQTLVLALRSDNMPIFTFCPTFCPINGRLKIANCIVKGETSQKPCSRSVENLDQLEKRQSVPGYTA